MAVSVVTTGDRVEATAVEPFSDLDLRISLASWKTKHFKNLNSFCDQTKIEQNHSSSVHIRVYLPKL